MDTTTLRTELEDSTRGLLFMSESDVPINIFEAETEFIQPYLQEQYGDTSNNVITEVNYDEFFQKYAVIKEWHNDIQKNFANKLSEALAILSESVSEIQVFRIGSTNIKLYMIGHVADNKWVGLESGLVETGD